MTRSISLAPRMELLVDRSQILTIDVSVDLRRRDVGVAEHLLHGTEIGTALQQVRREGVAEGVRRNVFLDPRLFNVVAQNLPRPHPREGPATRVENENALPFATLETRPQLAQIDRNGTDSGAPDRYEALLAALAEDANETFLEQDIANGERDPLRDA